MFRIPTRTALLGVLTIVSTACIPRVEQPQISLGGARLSSLGLSGGVVEVRLSVYNPNRFGLEASGLTYDLDFEDVRNERWLDFTDGVIERRIEVGAGETAEVVVPVEFSFRELGDLARGLLERGTFDYRVSGVVTLEEPLRRDIRFRHEGQVTPTGLR